MISYQTIPTSMNAIIAVGHGDVDVLQKQNIPVPHPNQGEVLVRVMAAGVNRPDIMQRKGLYPPPAGACPRLGLEIAGEVVVCGTSEGDGKILPHGSRVCALTNGGGYAEYCVVPIGQCLPWPKGLTAVQAAALPEACFTVWSNLFMPTILPTGTRVLIHGGASGIGTMAIQLVHAFGGEVYTTAGTEKKCALCKELGAVAAINYREEDFLSRIRALTDDMGVNAILDIIGGSYFNQNLKSLATDGKLVIIALQGGAKADQADLSRIMTRRLTVTGSTLRARNKANKICIAQDLYKHVWPLLEAGTAVPLIHAVFPLDRVADAHQIMEDGQHSGKIVLEC